MSKVSTAAERDPFKALADPTRRRVLELLHSKQACTAGEIANAFPHLSRPAVSRHLRVLRESGLVHAEGSGREQRYRLELEPLARLQREWLAQFTQAGEMALLALKEQVESRHATRRERSARTRGSARRVTPARTR